MANPTTPMGIRPINDNGTTWTGQATMVAFPAAQAGNIFTGDPLVALGGSDAFGVPVVGIASAGAGQPALGSMLSICNGPSGSGFTVTRDLPVYRQGGILNYGLACIGDQNQLFIVQEDSVGGAIAQAVAGFANANLVAGAGNLITGVSGWQMQSSSVAAAANPTYQLKIIGLSRGPYNAVGAYADWVVKLNNPQFAGTAGV